MKHFKKKLRQHWVLIIILCFGAILGLYRLDTLPGEMWGDATSQYALAKQILHGSFFYNYRFGGDGPIYSYLTACISLLLGLSFYTLKFTSVVIYLFFIATMYFLTDELFEKKEITYIATFLSAVSFWSITFARQPHARMLVPLFVAATVLFAVKKKTKTSGILLGLGMYSQASFWAMPLIFWKRYKILLIGLIITLPLVVSFTIGSTGFFTNQSYFGEKLATSDNFPPSEIVQNIGHNIDSNFFSFISRGDNGFRLNVPNSPQIDGASALFFFIGLLLLIVKSIKEKQMKYIEFIVLPFFLIQIPSILDIHNPLAQPNIGRMIGVIPFVYITAAYGLTTTWHAVIKNGFPTTKLKNILYYLCIFYLLLIIAIANIYKYFVIYPYFLPNHNLPLDRIIAAYINNAPSQSTFIFVNTGWGQWGQPEQQALIDEVHPSHNLTFLQPAEPAQTLCGMVSTSHPVTFITEPADTHTQQNLQSCKRQVSSFLIEKNSTTVARIINVK